MNKFKEHNITILRLTEEQRILTNKQRYFWNDKPIKYGIGKDVLRYCNLFNVSCDIEDTKIDNTSTSVTTYKLDKDWQEIVKDMIRIDNERDRINE